MAKKTPMEKLEITCCIFAIIAMFIAAYIASYDAKSFDQGKLDHMRNTVWPYATLEYQTAFNNALRYADSILPHTTEYKNAMQQLSDARKKINATPMASSDKTIALEEAAEKFYATRDSIKDATYTTALRNSQPLSHATDYLRNVNAEIDNLAADSAAYRKYLDTTTWHKRIQNNTQKFKNDVNTTLMKFYEKRLKTLKSKQENQK